MRIAMVLLVFVLALGAASLLPARQDDPRLDKLFAELQQIDKRRDERAGQLQARIWYIWYEHADPAVNAAMEGGLRALTQDRYPDALDAFDRAIELDPKFAEAWNRRGATYYLMGRYEDSLADIRRVLDLEPRHFSAMAGRGLCLRELGRPQAAIEAFREALGVNPHMDHVYIEILRLRALMESMGSEQKR